MTTRDYGTGCTPGTWVRYHGSVIPCVGQLVEVLRVYPGGRMDLETATGGKLRNVHFESITVICIPEESE